MKKIIICLLITVCMVLGCACGSSTPKPEGSGSAAAEPQNETAQAAEKNGDVYIIYTSDVHCGVDQGFGFAGLQEIRNSLEEQGFTTILVDDGDFIQGELIGAMTKGESIIEMMNALSDDEPISDNSEIRDEIINEEKPVFNAEVIEAEEVEEEAPQAPI